MKKSLLFGLLIIINSILMAQNPVADFNFTNVCLGTSTTFTDLTTNSPTTWDWSFGDGGVSTQQNPAYTYSSPGNYTVTLTVFNGVGYDSIPKVVTVFPNPTVNVTADQTICLGSAATLSATGGTTYNWSPTTGLSSSNVSNPSASPTSTTPYTVTVMDANGCTANDMIVVTVNPLPNVDAGLDQTICYGASTSLSASGAMTYNWSPGTGLSSTTASNPSANPTSTTSYTVTGTDASGCVANDMVTITVNPQIVLTDNVTNASCYGANDGSITVTPVGGQGPYNYFWTQSGSTTPTVTGLAPGTYTINVTDANGCVVIDSFNLNQPSPSGVIKGIVNFQSSHVTAGNVELIKKNGNTPADISTQSMLTMDTSGTFIFSNLYPGNYILKALGDTNIYDNVATYATNTNQWQVATVYYTSSCPGDTVSGIIIDLIELPANSGTGTINGRLVEGGGAFNKAPGEPIPDIDITVDQSPGGAIMAAATTDIDGYFTVTNLPMGTYTVYADMHGYGVTLQTIDINATTPSYDVVLCSDTAIDMIDMCEMTVTSVKKVATTNQLSIYPNPAKTTVNIVYNGSEALNLEVTDITGKKVMSQNLKSNTKTIDVANLSRGLYLVRLYNQHDDFIQKLVIE